MKKTSKSFYQSRRTQNQPSSINFQSNNIYQFTKTYFKIPSNILDQQQNKHFKGLQKPMIQYIGGLPYYIPMLGHKLGLNVSKIFDGGDDGWLEQNGNIEQWAYGYFGYEQKSKTIQYKQKGTNLSCFLQQYCKGPKMGKQGSYQNQIYKEVDYRDMNINQKSCSKQGQEIGKGICITPHYEKALFSVPPIIQLNQSLYLIFECRFDSSKVRIPKESNFNWVLPQSKYLRLTGLIFYTQYQYNKIKNFVKYSWFPYAAFKWEESEKSYYQFLKSSHLKRFIINKIDTTNLTILNLSNDKKHYPLEVNDIKQLFKANLDNIKQLYLTQNKIGNQGLRILARKNLGKLEKIKLNNNGITIRGLRYLLETKWNKNADVKLFSVGRQNCSGSFVEIDKNISTIQKIISSPPEKIFGLVEQIYQEKQAHLFQSFNLYFQMKKIQRQSETIEKSKILEKNINQQFDKSVETNTISLYTALKTLKDQYLNNQHVIYTQKSTVSSQLSCKIIFGGMIEERIKFIHKIFKDEWNYEEIIQDDEKLQKYISWYKQKMISKFGLNSDIMVHSISEDSIEGSIAYQEASNLQKDCVKNTINNGTHLKCAKSFLQLQMKIIPFFQGFELSPDDFDSKGDYQFPSIADAQTDHRGGLPYYQPVLGHRYGLNIINKYDLGNNQWLAMYGCKGQWAVGFHGVNDPHTSLKSIMNGRQTGTMIIPGANQVYQGEEVINKDNEVVSKGIYFSPHFAQCFVYARLTQSKSCKFRLIFQCRLKPLKIQIIKRRQEYWVLQSSKDVRPYGIILFTQNQYNQITQYVSRHPIHKQFDWNQNKEYFKTFHNL